MLLIGTGLESWLLLIRASLERLLLVWLLLLKERVELAAGDKLTRTLRLVSVRLWAQTNVIVGFRIGWAGGSVGLVGTG